MDWRIVVGSAAAFGVAVSIVTLIFKVGAWKGTTDGTVKQLGKDAAEDRTRIRQILDEIRGDIKSIFIRLGPAEAVGGSPLRLTDYGRTLLAGIDGAEWAVTLAQELKEQVKGMDAYEIQEFCFKYVEAELRPSDEQKAAMHRTAFQNAAQMKQVRRVLAIELRDRLLESAGLDTP